MRSVNLEFNDCGPFRVLYLRQQYVEGNFGSGGLIRCEVGLAQFTVKYVQRYQAGDGHLHFIQRITQS